MKKKVSFILLVIIGLSSIIFSVDYSITCRVSSSSCSSNEANLFYANKNFTNSPNKILSSNTATSGDSNYTRALCCKTNLGSGNLSASFMTESSSCSGTNNVDLLYFTNNSNARIGIKETSIYGDKGTDYNFTLSHYSHKLCVSIPDTFSSFHLIATNTSNRLEDSGYSCLFRISSLTNGVVSDCGATFNGGDKYDYTIFGKLNENTNSMICNSDCTSKLDNRVYTNCGDKIDACIGIPPVCNGALLGSWVTTDAGDQEVKCSAPWDEYRTSITSSSNIDIGSNSGDCENIIINDYPVLMDNEIVNMKIITCNN